MVLSPNSLIKFVIEYDEIEFWWIKPSEKEKSPMLSIIFVIFSVKSTK